MVWAQRRNEQTQKGTAWEQACSSVNIGSGRFPRGRRYVDPTVRTKRVDARPSNKPRRRREARGHGHRRGARRRLRQRRRGRFQQVRVVGGEEGGGSSRGHVSPEERGRARDDAIRYARGGGRDERFGVRADAFF